MLEQARATQRRNLSPPSDEKWLTEDIVALATKYGIYSSRRIAQGLKTDTAFMFLSGLQAPDFRTICLFRSQHASILPDLFVEVANRRQPGSTHITRGNKAIFFCRSWMGLHWTLKSSIVKVK